MNQSQLQEVKPLTPKYYRLLEKGEIIKDGDYFLLHPSDFKDEQLGVVTEGIGQRLMDYRPNWVFFRPVQVDEWIEYEKQKPTKEDFEPTGSIDALDSCGTPSRLSSLSITPKGWNWSKTTFWRRITPPQPAKPKTIVLKKTDGREIQLVTPNSDGTAKLGCGDVISAESIKEFMQTYEEVVGTKPHPR